jgi:hypothetical protein
MNCRFLIILAICVLAVSNLSAQKTETLCGEYTYYAPESVSPEQAKRTALERARLKIVENRWGSYIRGDVSTFITNTNSDSSIDMFVFNTSDLNGEWISDVEEPKYEISWQDGFLICKASICIKARQKSNVPHVDIDYKVLRKGLESTSFRSGDELYLQFQSPVKGYLSVYLLDESNAYCMLPYQNDTDGKADIESGKSYTFFHIKSEQENPSLVDEYLMQTTREEEMNELYIIFSPNEFTKANDSKVEQQYPRQLKRINFYEWLSKNRSRDRRMQVDVVPLTIRK